MKDKICNILAIALLFIYPAASFGDEAGLQVSVRNGLVSISSTKSTLSEILARLSQEIDMKINAHGAQENAVVACEIDGAGIAETLQKLVPEWNTLVFSREERSIEIGVNGREDQDATQGEPGMRNNAKGKEADSSLNEEGSETQGEEAAQPPEAESSDSMPPEISNDENNDEPVGAEPPQEEFHEDDDAAASETAATERKSRSRRHGSWQF
ncbi:hypothetical protein SAMN04489760_14020 [Syntrophus gentianae]|uniref:Uncharacterized protein n=1 Tax=Syntrophus gentianae TaxID=43775 RepID=A0A1H8AVH3_9BACT|nr:hypothetical protein [Syntrophus gentianae]SEM73799.1 hypothetical protein SAMN04489760_14020 [Syntrophus gentianae]